MGGGQESSSTDPASPASPPELDFNVSGAFVGQPALNSNHLHTGLDYDSGTLERKRPVSMAVMDGELLKKER